MRSFVVFALLCVGCQDTTLTVSNGPPNVLIHTPLELASYAPGDLIEFEGVVSDDLDQPEELAVTWLSSIDGVLGEPAPDAEGLVYLALSDLSGGDHVITLEAVDEGLQKGNASVAITVGYGDDNEGAPTVILIGPAEGEQFLTGSEVTFVGTATDEEQAWDTLDITLTSTRDGLFWSGNPASNGAISVPWTDLSEGLHNITLTAQDEDGNTASDDVDIEMLADGRPTAVISSPTSGAMYWTDESVPFEGVVADLETDTELLLVSWDSDLDGNLTSGNPDSSGFTAVGTSLSEGLHVITLSVVDGDAKEGSDSITLEIVDPLDYDDDGDGYTENDGDCDDGDASVYPTASEACDDVDNDCGGDINEDWWDTYESNDSSSSPYDLGEVDSGMLWAGDSLTLSGLTLHYSGDDDWFMWDADDDWYDNVNITVTVRVPSTGDYVAELYLDDGGWNLEDSESGNGSLTLSYTGDLFDEDEDDFAVRVYANTWPSKSCSETYDIQIDS